MKISEYEEILIMLIDDIIQSISKLKSINRYEAMELFYLSPVCKMIYQKDTGLYTQSAMSLAYRCIK